MHVQGQISHGNEGHGVSVFALALLSGCVSLSQWLAQSLLWVSYL